MRGAAAPARVGSLAGWHRWRLLHQIGDELGLRPRVVLLVNNVVAVEDAALCPVRSMATRSGTFARIRLRAAVRRQSWRKRVRPRPTDRRGATPCASANGKPSRWKTSGLSGSRVPAVAHSASAIGGEMGRMRPTNVFERPGESG